MIEIQNSLIDWLEEPFKFAVIKRSLNLRYKSRIRYLDIGCGNHSARLSYKYLHNLEYWGVDKGTYNNDHEDFTAMYRFIDQDVEEYEFTDVPNAYFDIVVLSHVLEHFENYKVVISKVLPKLSENGIIYIETPTIQSTTFPSREGTLNFFDDNTHLNPVPFEDVEHLLESKNFIIVSHGIRKFKRRIFLFPLFLFFSIYKYGSVVGPVLWDIYGFSWYLVAAPS